MPDPLDELYAAPLDAFVAERGRLAAALTKKGDKEAAKDVKAARKPTISAWIVNQIAHHQQATVKDLLKASADVVHAQLDAAGGDEERERLARAMQHQRDVEDTLKEAIRQVVGRPSADLMSRVLDNFRRGAMDPESRPLLRAGRLTRDLPPHDFGSILQQLTEGRRPARRPTAKPPKGKPRSPDKTEQARKKAEQARAAAESARREKAAQVEQRRAQTAARTLLARAERRVEDLRSELASAEEAMEAARAQLRALEKAR